MKQKTSKYVSKKPDGNGFIQYDDTENETWAFLYKRQMEVIQNRACDEYIRGLEKLNLPEDRIPQLPDINAVLQQATGWQVAAVPALIPFGEFFKLLANKQFPAATFIRNKDEIDYLQEPDIFHEIYGHCPLLTDSVFAQFSHEYGKLGLNATPKERMMLARIYWFTVEFGLISTSQGLRIYGAGILSSKGETVYALESEIPELQAFDVEKVLRTPYRIDIYQTIYYIINQFENLYDAINKTLLPKIQKAYIQGDFEPTYPIC